MANRTSSIRALGIGFVAGLRSLTAPAAVSWAAGNGRLSLRNSPLSLLDTERAESTTRKLALGELVSDKTPLLPSRLKPGSLLFRLLSGGICGAAFSISEGENFRRGAALGAAGALVGSLLGYAWRTRVLPEWHIPDFAGALVEDGVALGLAASLVSCPMHRGARDAWADTDNPAWLP
jgi:uncharacterized membrane protein